MDTETDPTGLQASGAMDMDLNVSASEGVEEGEETQKRVAHKASKGGIKYEVLLEVSKAATPLRTQATVFNTRPISAEVIQMKIEAAAERRQSMETERLAALTEKIRRVEEVAKKREDELLKFSISTKENLEQKIEASTVNRETLISDMKTKLSTHNTNHLQEVRQNLVSNLTDFEEKAKQEIQNKLELAEKNREKVLQEKLESLKKHDEKVEMIRIKRSSSVVIEDMPQVVPNENQ